METGFILHVTDMVHVLLLTCRNWMNWINRKH